ncbi:MAG: protein of unknown function (DUF4911) [Candidatus Electronema aureum]|uniref:DUF4911 domain-containing protein n=1 Tax=Candidatus Electronema aureum TaxID=2005002 RepID=A0A521G5N0_9BACT|nr:MAG: protein of unknown function (DUF4911) [Candidatus Electronema aureum]
MRTFYLRIRPDRISLFRFLLEGYDGLAVLSTLDARQGLVRLIVPKSRYAELWALLAAICEELVHEGKGLAKNENLLQELP